MIQFVKGQRIQYTRHGFGQRGTIAYVGHDLLEVQPDSSYRFADDYVVINKNQVIPQTPAQKHGLEVGDEVTINRASIRGLRGRIFFYYDDKTSIPQFRDEFGNRHFVTLSDVTKVAVSNGPQAGVLWTDAPQGSTHYSFTAHHDSKWHKLDANGEWHFAITDSNKRSGFIKYGSQRDANAESQVAMPVQFRTGNPLNDVAAEVVELESQARTKQSQLDSLTREVARINTEKQTKMAIITAAGFKVVNGKLEAIVVSKPVREWKAGDQVRCITTANCGMAELTAGKLYTVTDRFGVTCVSDNAGDRMGDCVKAGCFVWVEAGEDLSQVPVQRWKRGDTILNVGDEDRGHRDITIGKEYKLVANGVCEFVDNAGDRRHRTASDYVLVRRA